MSERRIEYRLRHFALRSRASRGLEAGADIRFGDRVPLIYLEGELGAFGANVPETIPFRVMDRPAPHGDRRPYSKPDPSKGSGVEGIMRDRFTPTRANGRRIVVRRFVGS